MLVLVTPWGRHWYVWWLQLQVILLPRMMRGYSGSYMSRGSWRAELHMMLSEATGALGCA
jgi:hypothetical protein